MFAKNKNKIPIRIKQFQNRQYMHTELHSYIHISWSIYIGGFSTDVPANPINTTPEHPQDTIMNHEKKRGIEWIPVVKKLIDDESQRGSGF